MNAHHWHATQAERNSQPDAVTERQCERTATVLERVRDVDARLVMDSYSVGKPPSGYGL